VLVVSSCQQAHCDRHSPVLKLATSLLSPLPCTAATSLAGPVTRQGSGQASIPSCLISTPPLSSAPALPGREAGHRPVGHPGASSISSGLRSGSSRSGRGSTCLQQRRLAVQAASLSPAASSRSSRGRGQNSCPSHLSRKASGMQRWQHQRHSQPATTALRRNWCCCPQRPSPSSSSPN
jgi:type IV secretory pathway TrbL component